jgi:hypothetical protein
MNERLQEVMVKYLEAARERAWRNIEDELKLAFMTGALAGTEEMKRIGDRIYEQWETRDAFHNQSH